MDKLEQVARAIDDATWANFDNYAKLKRWTEAERVANCHRAMIDAALK